MIATLTWPKTQPVCMGVCQCTVTCNTSFESHRDGHGYYSMVSYATATARHGGFDSYAAKVAWAAWRVHRDFIRALVLGPGPRPWNPPLVAAPAQPPAGLQTWLRRVARRRV